MTAVLVRPMPRKPKRNDEVVKVDAEVVRMARIISSIEGVALAELLSETLRPIFIKRIAEIEQKGILHKPKK